MQHALAKPGCWLNLELRRLAANIQCFVINITMLPWKQGSAESWNFFHGFISHSLSKKGIMICVACHLLGVMFGIVQNSIGKNLYRCYMSEHAVQIRDHDHNDTKDTGGI